MAFRQLTSSNVEAVQNLLKSVKRCHFCLFFACSSQQSFEEAQYPCLGVFCHQPILRILLCFGPCRIRATLLSSIPSTCCYFPSRFGNQLTEIVNVVGPTTANDWK